MIYDVLHSYYENEYQKHCELKQAMQRVKEVCQAQDDLAESHLEEIALEMEKLELDVDGDVGTVPRGLAT